MLGLPIVVFTVTGALCASVVERSDEITSLKQEMANIRERLKMQEENLKEQEKQIIKLSAMPHHGAGGTGRVLIIGAGVSGLRAAQELLRHGVDVTVLEASHRVGGRVWSVPYYDITAEMGAHWVQHVHVNNPIWRLAQELNIQGIQSDAESYVFRDSSGRDVTKEADEKYMNFPGYKGVVEAGQELASKGIPDRNARTTLRLLGWQKPTSGLRKAIEFYDFEFEMGDEPEMMSTKHLPGKLGDFFVNDKRGYSIVPQKMAENITSHPNGRILLDQWVNRTEYGKSHCRVTTKSGRVFEGDACISTVSLGVLQRETIEFVPPLPEWKRSAIHKHLFVYYSNLYFKFPNNTTRFWDDTEYIVYAGPKRGYYTVWANYEAAGIQPEKTGILMVNLVGEELLRVIKLPKAAIIAEAMGVLRKMYGPSIPDAIDVLVPPIATHPLFYGSFSSWPIGFTSDDMDAFRAPLQRLYFAGEACSRFFFGYVHGAYSEGIDAARRVLACLRGSCESYIPK